MDTCARKALHALAVLAAAAACALCLAGAAFADETPVASALTDADLASFNALMDEAQAAEGAQGDAGEATLADDAKRVIELWGETQYDTAAQEALYEFESSDYAIIASGQGYVDALAAVSLAGAYECPILLTAKQYLPDTTAEALEQLGVKHIFVIGGTGVITSGVRASLRALAGSPDLIELWGQTQFDTQMKIYEYGADRNLWGSTIIVASGSLGGQCFADSLSASPLAYKLKAPVFLVDDEGDLPDAAAQTLVGENSITQVLLIGGTAVLSAQTEGFCQAVVMLNGANRSGVVRLAGDTLYDTSAAVAQWAVGQGILEWDNAAFATGAQPYDALAGSAVQGNEGSVMLLIDDGCYTTLSAAALSGAAFTKVKFFGGPAVVSQSTRDAVNARLLSDGVVIVNKSYNITLDELTDIEVAASGGDSADVREALDPDTVSMADSDFLQFAVLSDGYSGAVSAADLDAFIARWCVYSEAKYGVTSKLRNTGAYFVEAAQTYGVNEVYLLAHAIVESAWGCSTLSQGAVEGYEGYYNFFGIGAYDYSPLLGGGSHAEDEGWNTVRLAILGGAQFIADSYIIPTARTAAASGQQNTLYKMRWDVQNAADNGRATHCYATNVGWPTSIAGIMQMVYDYCELDLQGTGLRFELPAYK